MLFLKSIVSIFAGLVTNRSKLAAAEAGVPLETILCEMGSALTTCSTEQADWNTAGLDALMQHIVVRHHAYLRKELPLMERLVARARETRGRADANTLVPLGKVFRFFKRELENENYEERGRGPLSTNPAT